MFDRLQKGIGLLLILAGFFVIFMDAPQEVYGQALRIITPTQGGTGFGSTTAGNIGNCLKVLSDSPFTYELGTCGSGSSGGGGADNNWAWNSANNFVYSDSASTTATTSARSYFFTGTSTTDANTFPLASTTALTATRAYLTQLANLTGNGFVKTDSSNGTLSIDTNTYLTADQSVSNWLYNGSRLTPSTTVGIGVFASSTIGNGTATGGLTINGSGTTTGTSTMHNIIVGGHGQTLQSGIVEPAGFINASTTGRSGILYQNYGYGTAPEFRFTIGDPRSSGALEYLSLGLTNSDAITPGSIYGVNKSDLVYIISNSARDMVIGSGGGDLHLGTDSNAVGLIQLDAATQRVLIGSRATSTPTSTLSVNGDIYTANITATGTASSTNASTTNMSLYGKLFDRTVSAGTNGMVLQTNGSGITWVATSTLGIVASGDGVSNWTYNGSRLTPSTTVGITVNATSTLATTSISRLLLQLATTTKQSVGGGGPESITNMRTNTNDLMLWSGLNTDTEGRFLIETSGFMGWGAGGSTDQDMSLYRSGVGGLAAQSFTDNSTDAFRVNQVDGSAVLTVNTTSEYVSTPWLLVNGAGGGAKMDVYGGGTTAIRAEQPSASDVAFSAFVTGDAQLRFSFLADGTQKWGSGSLAGDTQLYRTGAGHLSLIPAGASTEARLGIGSTTPSRALTVAGDIVAANITATGSATSTVSFFSGLGTFTNAIINTLLTAVNAVFTGLVDIGAGVLEIPNGVAPTVDSIGELAIDSTSNQLVLYGSEKKVIGNGNIYSSFTYATSTAWTGTTTIPLGTAYVAETWNGIQCFTDAGTLNVSVNDGTNRMNTNAASTTVGTTVFSTNNTFTANEKRYVDIGTPASSPTKISCTVSKSITAD